jgi:hypothetical protein
MQASGILDKIIALCAAVAGVEQSKNDSGHRKYTPKHPG